MTADTQAHVAVVDAVTGRIVRRIPTLPDPRSIENVGGAAVVAHTARGLLSIVDVRTLEVRRVLGAVEAPRYAAAHPAGRWRS